MSPPRCILFDFPLILCCPFAEQYIVDLYKFVNLHIHVGNILGTLSACSNCILKYIISFAQPKIEFEILN